jgi:hypothetical protein
MARRGVPAGPMNCQENDERERLTERSVEIQPRRQFSSSHKKKHSPRASTLSAASRVSFSEARAFCAPETSRDVIPRALANTREHDSHHFAPNAKRSNRGFFAVVAAVVVVAVVSFSFSKRASTRAADASAGSKAASAASARPGDDARVSAGGAGTPGAAKYRLRADAGVERGVR